MRRTLEVRRILNYPKQRIRPLPTMTTQINPQTKMGTVALTVSDFARSLPYYQERIGLQLRQQEGSVAHLGTSQRDLLILHENKSARPVNGRTGLYHFALLVSSRFELARTLMHLVQTETPLQGMSDHFVSEAIYLADPDGNGIEIYRDRPRAQWEYPNGKLNIGTAAMDVNGVLAELQGQNPIFQQLDDQTVMGHIHLHISKLDRDEAFYKDVLGFDLVTRYGTAASFVSAGGYHHHIGMNTWAGVNIPPPPPDATGLRWFTIELPDEAALQATLSNLDAQSVAYEQQQDGIFLHDTAGNGIRLITIKT